MAGFPIDRDSGVEVTLKNGLVLFGRLERAGEYGDVLRVEKYKNTPTGILKRTGSMVLGIGHPSETLRGITFRKIASLTFDPTTLTLSVEE